MTENGKKIRVGVVQNSPEFGSIERNFEEVRNLVLGIKREHVDLLVLPELFATGYQFVSRSELEDLAEEEKGPTFAFLKELSRETGAIVVGGVPIKRPHGITNSALVVSGSTLLESYDKIHLFDEERDFFARGEKPLPIIPTPFGPMGVMICFDWLFPEALRSLALGGALVVAHPSNWVLPFGPQGMILRSVENRVFTVTANRVGREARGGKPPLTYIGKSQVVGPNGQVVAQADSDRPDMIFVEISPSEALSKKVASKSDFFEQRRTDLYRI
jgi:predicted amidohydrolase